MGVISWVLGQVAITSIALGALKRNHVIELQPQNVKNDTLRLAVVQAIALGEEATIMAERFVASIMDEVDSSKRNGGGTAVPVPVTPVLRGAAAGALDALPPAARAWAAASGAKWGGVSGELLLVPGDQGSLAAVLLCLDAPCDVWGWAALARLPAGSAGSAAAAPGAARGATTGAASAGAVFEIDAAALAALGGGGGGGEGADTRGGGLLAPADAALLGWMLGGYRFERYRGGAAAAGAAARPRLVAPPGADRRATEALARAFFFARDLINTPASDLGPAQLAAEAAAMAAEHAGAAVSVVSGDGLLAAGYPAVHTVGRASDRPPALVDITWSPPHGDSAGSSSSSTGAGGGASSEGRSGASSGGGGGQLPLVALVGKGVCFDTGGLNIKTGPGMKLMKKDMGGAALVLALAHVLMVRSAPLRLRLLVPAVENSVGGGAFRPLDVLATRAGITVEQGNCDAEGRLILADCLYEVAAASAPDLIIDAATLTGAARAALGPELPAVFSNDERAWRELEAAAQAQSDPLWRLPLHAGYRRLLDSKVADIGSVSADAGGQGGAIVAALFLREFVNAGARDAAAGDGSGSGGADGGVAAACGSAGADAVRAGAPAWLHVDTGAWVFGGAARPGRPEGGEALGLMALAAMLQARYEGGAARDAGVA